MVVQMHTLGRGVEYTPKDFLRLEVQGRDGVIFCFFFSYLLLYRISFFLQKVILTKNSTPDIIVLILYYIYA